MTSERSDGRPLRVLLLGASDTLGNYLPDRTQGTFETMQRELPERLRQPVELRHVRFYSHFPQSDIRAEAAAREADADVVILACHSMGFSVRSIGARLVHLSGWKVGRWLERRIWDVDARAKRGGVLGKLREPVRTAAYRVIGTAAYTDVETTIRHYSDTIKRLARLEATRVIVAGTFTPVPGADLRPHQRLNEGLAAACAQHRCTWVNRMTITEELGSAAFQTERVGSTAALHRGVADALMEAVEG